MSIIKELDIDYEKKLKNKRPFERFVYILGWLRKRAKESGQDYSQYDMRTIKKEIKKRAGLKAHHMKKVEVHKIVDLNVYNVMADLCGATAEELLGDSEFEYVLKSEESPEEVKEDAPKRRRTPKSESKKDSSTLMFENLTDFHLSLDIKDGVIRIYLNEFAPKTAKHVLLKTQRVRVGSGEVEKTFPVPVKIE